jgi:hypothetical protein
MILRDMANSSRTNVYGYNGQSLNLAVIDMSDTRRSQ